MRVRVKVCGITTAEAVGAAIDAGADAVGFVFAPSPRRLDPRRAADLAALVPPPVARVGVFRHPSPEDAAIARLVPLDVIQSDWPDLPVLRDAAPATSFVPVFRDSASIADEVAAFLVAHPGTRCILAEGPRSGVGIAPDWSRLAPIARRIRLILAGGLTPENVADAIRTVRPYAVDVSSGVESGRGVKDPVKIRAFLSAVRDAEPVGAPDSTDHRP